MAGAKITSMDAMAIRRARPVIRMATSRAWVTGIAGTATVLHRTVITPTVTTVTAQPWDRRPSTRRLIGRRICRDTRKGTGTALTNVVACKFLKHLDRQGRD